MANSGSSNFYVTKYDSIRFSWETITQSAAGNYTSIRWKLELVSVTNGLISSTASKKWSVTVNGFKYSGTNTVGIGDNQILTLASGSTDISHNDDGTKVFNYSFEQEFGITFGGVYVGTITGSGIGTLNPIGKKSTLEAADGILGESLPLTVFQQVSNLTHTITYKCGGASGTIVSKSSETDIWWTPPLDLASQAPSANGVAVTLTITTYNGNTEVGSHSETIICTIPITNDFVPVLMPTISDATGIMERLGCWVQGQSKLKADITTYGAYGAWISSVKTSVDFYTYNGTSVVSNALANYGELPVHITSVDSRGRMSVSNTAITVLPYSLPKITSLTATRCDQDGTPNPKGSYMLAKFSATLSDLDGKNTARYFVGYKKSSEADHTAVELTNLANTYSVNSSYVFPADPDSNYTVIFTAVDQIGQARTTTTGPSVAKVWSLLKKAGLIVGMAVGKIAELEGIFDIGWQTKFSGGIFHPVLTSNTNLNDLTLPATYVLRSANNYTNLPESGKGAFLEIVGIKDETLIQRCSIFDRANPRVYERIYYESTGWGDWRCVRGDFVVEQGELNGWTYRKWNSGLAECWKIHEFSTTINTAFGSLYCGNATQRQNYPFTFTEKPVETVTLQCGSTQAFLYAEASGYGVNGASASARYNVFRPGAMANSQTFYLSFYVTGKWKE